MPQGAVVVIDLGKTLAKVSLWSRAGEMLDRQVRPNPVVAQKGIRRLDAEGIAAWLIEALSSYADQSVEAIVPVGHGAAIAAVVDDKLVELPFDYEQAIPADVTADYRKQRAPFAETGSPALPDGLNIGAQLHWLTQMLPEAIPLATLLPWPQYWAWFLSGQAVSEVTSLGCHSDLWCPASGRFSALAERRGWADRFAPLVKAGDVIGTLRPDLAARTGLSTEVRVLAGLHDSNAALLAARGFHEIANGEATVLSTGTWFVAMRMPTSPVNTAALPEARDCLVNVDVYGQPVPSARFMGGREVESIIGIDTRRVDIKPDQPALLGAVPRVLEREAMLFPTLAPGCGPFPDHHAEWQSEPTDWIETRAAMCLYAALVTDAALRLIGTKDRLLVEGRFAEAEVFVRALAALRPDLTVYTANAHNDVSFGALRLIDPALKPQGALVQVAPLNHDLNRYRAAWAKRVEEAR